MAKKKALLVLLLLVSLGLMLVIVYFIKTRFGYFGYSYNQYIEDMALRYDGTIETNMDKIKSEIEYLSRDNIVKSVYESSSRGEDTGKYFNDFDKVRNAIEDCQKIQILDSDGNIIFSVDTNEINKIRIVRPIMAGVKDYLATNDFTYIYMLKKDSLAAFYKVDPEYTATTNGGFVVIYYKMAKLFTGISSGQIVADGAISNMLITSRLMLNNNNVNYLMSYMKNPEMYTKIEKNEKSNYVVKKNIHGIEVLYFPTNEKYIPVLGGIALSACLILFFLVVTALIMIMRDEKIISDIPVKPVNVNLRREITPKEKPDEIKTLIEDIEGNKPYGDMEAKKGIEDMIMADGINLTEAFPVPEENEQPSIPSIEPEEPAVNSGIETFESIKPTKQTDLFAEEERILNNIESKVPNKEEKPVYPGELPEEDEFKLTESFEEPEFPAFEEPVPEVETIPLDIMSEPPQKVSSILTVDDYGRIAVDLAKNLNFGKSIILEKNVDRFIPKIKEGIITDNFMLLADDPIFTMFLSGGKGLDIKGNAGKIRYFTERFDSRDIEDVDEIFLTPIIKDREMAGLAIFLKKKGFTEPTHYQKCELLNLSFLQDH